MRRWIITAALAASTLTPCVGNRCGAQEQERAPVLNSIGRFLGVGFSAGYHARYDSRLGIKHTPPSANVVPSPYHQAAYSHPSAFAQMPVGQYQLNGPMAQPIRPTLQPGLSHGPGSAATKPYGETVPAVPKKPSVPPPSWLRPFLKPDGTTFESVPDAASPSDRRGVQISPSSEKTSGLFIVPDPSSNRDYSVLKPQ